MAYTINDAINDGRRNAKVITDVTIAASKQVIDDNRRAHNATQDVVVSSTTIILYHIFLDFKKLVTNYDIDLIQ